MCGFAGFCDYNEDLLEGRNLWLDRVRSMARRLSHRGPDDAGAHLSAHCALGHVRLAILDPEHGAQPMTATVGEHTVTLAYNGELYNTDALRGDLTARGYAFETRCDTEVLLKAYLCYGEDCAEKLTASTPLRWMTPARGRPSSAGTASG